MGGRGRPREAEREAEGGRGSQLILRFVSPAEHPVVTQPYFFMRFRQVGLGPGRVSNDGIGDHRGKRDQAKECGKGAFTNGARPCFACTKCLENWTRATLYNLFTKNVF